MKKLKWREVYEAFDDKNARIDIYKDWIAYKTIGFDPNVHKDMLEEKQAEIDTLKQAIKKWEKEFKKKY